MHLTVLARPCPWIPGLVLAFLTSAAALGAQQQPTLTPADYGSWETLGAYELDPTGAWLVASIRRVDETTELRLHRADGSGEPQVLEHATRPSFSADGRFMLKGEPAARWITEGESWTERERRMDGRPGGF